MNFLKKLFSFYRKIWQMLNKAGTVFFLLVIAGMIVYNLGFPKEVNETLEGQIFTEDGQSFPCTLEVTGESTYYLFKKKVSLDALQIRAGGRLLNTVSDIRSSKKPVALQHQTWDVTMILHWDQRQLLMECDLQRIFPEKDSMRCVVVCPTMEAGEAAALLEASDIPEAMKAHFDWFIG